MFLTPPHLEPPPSPLPLGSLHWSVVCKLFPQTWPLSAFCNIKAFVPQEAERLMSSDNSVVLLEPRNDRPFVTHKIHSYTLTPRDQRTRDHEAKESFKLIILLLTNCFLTLLFHLYFSSRLQVKPKKIQLLVSPSEDKVSMKRTFRFNVLGAPEIPFIKIRLSGRAPSSLPLAPKPSS